MNRIISVVTILLWIASPMYFASAFQVPATSTILNSGRNTFSVRSLQQLYMSDVDEASVEEEVERIFQEEKEKTLRMSRFSNEKGVEYAPWMNMSPEDEARIRTLAREKTVARKKRQMQEQNVRGSLLKDSTNQELSDCNIKLLIPIRLNWNGPLIPNQIRKDTLLNVVHPRHPILSPSHHTKRSHR